MKDINWLEEAQKYEAALVADLQGWIQIPSVKDETPDVVAYPVGIENRKALDYFLALGTRDGFTTKNIDNIAGHIEVGAGDALFGVLGHSDVVPVGDGWSQDPFSGAVIDGYMYGRGTQDDKGPMIASYYAIKMIQDLGLPLSKRIRLINGTDEESGFTCMDRYFQTEEMPALGFSPDANFPLIYGEKGMVNFNINIHEVGNELISFTSGMRLNMVPDTAEAVLCTPHDLETSFRAYLADNKLTGTYSKDADTQILTVEGQAVHGMKPEEGVNAAYLLVDYLLSTQIHSNFVTAFAALLLNDTKGVKMNIAHSGEMGGLTVNAGVVRTVAHTFTISINLRHSQEWDQAAGIATIVAALSAQNATYEELSVKTPLYVSPTDPFIQTLTEVYQKQTGDYDSPLMTTGGGTYASVMDKGVAFGMLFNGTEDRMHQIDERVPVIDLIKATAIYAEAIYKLTKK